MKLVHYTLHSISNQGSLFRCILEITMMLVKFFWLKIIFQEWKYFEFKCVGNNMNIAEKMLDRNNKGVNICRIF